MYHTHGVCERVAGLRACRPAKGRLIDGSGFGTMVIRCVFNKKKKSRPTSSLCISDHFKLVDYIGIPDLKKFNRGCSKKNDFTFLF